MTDKKKTLLNEGTVRRFMALAGVESLVNPFLKKVNEAVPPLELNTPPESFQTPTAPDETPTETPEVVEEAEELEEGEELEEAKCPDAGSGTKDCPFVVKDTKKCVGPGCAEEQKESPTSRTLAESILRHIPNLEIVDDESTFKTARQSDILQEVLRRVKEKLS